MPLKYNFIEKLNKVYNDNIPYTLEGTFVSSEAKILVSDALGHYLIAPKHLLRKVLPSVNSCLDKNEWLKRKFLTVHGERYDYSKIRYVNSTSPVEIVCRLHGSFYQKTVKHFAGQGCIKCSRLSAKEKRWGDYDFFSRITSVHRSKYDCSKTIYTNMETNITVRCSIHGLFTINPNNFISGRGCQKCGYAKRTEQARSDSSGWSSADWVKSAEKSKNFHSFKVYIIKCYGEKEVFYKIGRTFRTIERRFKNNMPYCFDVKFQMELDPSSAIEMERNLKRRYKHLKYLPNTSFSGMHECFDLTLPVDKIIEETK